MDDLEKSEAAGTIGLDTLRRAAAALDCSLVYAIVPNGSLESLVDERARVLAKAALARAGQTMRLENQHITHVDKAEFIEDYIRGHLRDRDLWNAT